MTYVVQEACVKCKYGDCVEVCPVDCFYEAENMLVINPDECIDCSACVPACPVEAISSEDDAEEGVLLEIKENQNLDDEQDDDDEDEGHKD